MSWLVLLSRVTKVVRLSLMLAPLFSCTYDKNQSQDKEKYTRQECIVKIDLDWSGYELEQIEEVIRNIGDALRRTVDQGKAGNIPSYTFPWRKIGEWYMQFHEDCENKYELASELIKIEVVPYVENVPPYIISREVVVPSPGTIYVKGEPWKEDNY